MKSTNTTGIEERVKYLRDILEYHNQKYYVEDNPEISDFEYDELYSELVKLEKENLELITEESPTQRVGGEPLKDFQKVSHKVTMQGLIDVFDNEELIAFDRRVRETLGNDYEYVVEKKIDGLSVSLEYENGIFIRGATRGNGLVGEDVTQNLKTIKSIPLKLKNTDISLTVRGEVFIAKKDFKDINKEQEEAGQAQFANPRNAAAGSLRQLDSKIASKRKLDIYVFNIQEIEGKVFSMHSEALDFLKTQGFKVSPSFVVCKNIEEVIKEIGKIGEERHELGFDIDGAVVKVNLLAQRELLGNTSKAPKWAVAYKYPAEKKRTIIQDIWVNVGRTGVLTPNAVLKPVRLAGTTVSRATLHNMDYINDKDIRIGDTVWVQKAGDIIPEVVEVDREKRTGGEIPFKMHERCPVCDSKVEREDGEVAFRCTNINCPAQLTRSIIHFVSRDAMNIEGLGSSIVEILYNKGFIESIADLYYLYKRKNELLNIERMGEKSVENLLNSIEKSKSNNIDRLIFGFGIRHIGLKASQILSECFGSIEDIIKSDVEEISNIPEFGQKMAESLKKFFQKEQTIKIVENLKEAGVNLKSKGKQTLVDTRFEGMTFVLTGALRTFTRDEAGNIIKNYGGKVSSSVSKKTSCVLAGEDAGSKLLKANDLGVKVVDENEFMKMIEGNQYVQ